MTNSIMLDLETMGNRSDAAIVAVGAVRFDENGIKDEFYRVVTLESSLAAGLTVDASTVRWWLGQSEEARNGILSPGTPLCEVLFDFVFWIGEDAKVWGNGAAFDNTILRNAYLHCNISPPWAFWNDRCYRTVKNLHPGKELIRVGVHHNALDDARSQAVHLLEIFSDLGVKDGS